jgi:hypothetical protein
VLLRGDGEVVGTLYGSKPAHHHPLLFSMWCRMRASISESMVSFRRRWVR